MQVGIEAAATGLDFWKAVVVLQCTGGRMLQLRLQTRYEMRELLGQLHVHCIQSAEASSAADEAPDRVPVLNAHSVARL